MKKIMKAAVAVCCLFVGMSAIANVMTATRQLDGGTVPASTPGHEGEFQLVLSGKVLTYVEYSVSCHLNNPTAAPVIMQASPIQMYNKNGMYISSFSVQANGQYVQNQFALKAGDNTVSFAIVGIRQDHRGFISLRNLDDTAVVTVSNCVANPVL